MKTIKILLSVMVLFFASFSCDEALDVNTDPLAATSADPNAVLPYVFVQYSARKVTELGTRIADVSQYLSANFNSPRNGSTTSFLTGNTWRMMYVQILGNLLLIEEDAEEAGPTSNNVAAMAKIMKALVFYELTSIWEEVPFSEALNGQEFPNPQFDSQEAVLRGSLGILDEAIGLIDAMPTDGNFQVAQGDMIYGGNMTLWRRYANSLKLRILMILRNQVSVDTEIAAVLSQPLMTDNSHAAMLRYAGGPGEMNAMQNIVQAFFGPDNESTDVHGPGDPFYNILQRTSDPRFDLMIARNDLQAPGNGVFPSPSTAVISNNVIRGDLPDIWMLPAEIDFYRAELALKGVAAAGDARTNFENGLTNILEFWGGDIPGAPATIAQADIDAFVAAWGTPTLDEVYEQEYLAAFLHPVLAWNHVRRNKVPAIVPPPTTNISTILKRFTYPPNEIAANKNTPANQATDVPMWFEN